MKTNNRFAHRKTVLCTSIALLFAPATTVVHAASTDIANVPMAVSNMVTPNVLTIFDNSESMDGYMAGQLVAGNNTSTRSNIGRNVMRNAITTYRSAFNWGLMTYGLTSAAGLYNTYAYYLGSNTGMVFTDDCVGYVAAVPATDPPVSYGISASNGGRRCLPVPAGQTFTGGHYVTFDKTGDDPDINDVLYDTAVHSTMWALTSGAGTGYKFYDSHKTTSGNSWTSGDFTGDPFGCGNCNISFTPTDAGYLPSNPPITRQLYIPRAWGYLQNITGFGTLNEAVKVDTVAHYNTLQNLLAGETNSATGEIKNGAVFTPLNGTLQSAKNYFTGGTSPVQYTCQQNFVMLVTDGLPTGDTAGHLYSAADRTSTCNWSTASNTCTTGTLSTAANDVITSVKALRTITVPGYSSIYKDGTGFVTGKYDVQTYVVALGDTAANANAMSIMNAMAYNGGTDQAIQASSASDFQHAIDVISNDITAKVGASSAVAITNQNVTSSDNASYTSSFNSGTWTGDVLANAIDIYTGVPSATPLWGSSAATQLDARTPASRYIVSSTDSPGSIGGVQFQPAAAATATKLSAAQQTLLNTPTLTDGAAVLAYLRGDRSGEPATYRPRAHLLGDTIASEPVLVREPSATYADTGYAAFKATNATRARILFQGANDGMLHAFVAATGAEAWAYVPNLVMGTLNNLSKKTGFTHLYF